MTPKHHVVSIDTWVKLPKLNLNHKLHSITNWDGLTGPAQLDKATILVCSNTRVDEALLQHAPLLQLVVTTGTGTDLYDREAIRGRGITLCNVPAENTVSVSEHAVALILALKRQIIPMHELTTRGDLWPRQRAPHLLYANPPRTNCDETLVRQSSHVIHQDVITNVL
jgi:glycerate dehydrogenase